MTKPGAELGGSNRPPARRASFTTRIITVMIAVVFTVVLTTATVSYVQLRELSLAVADRTLSSQVNLLATDLENRISTLAENVRTLAANSLIANALVDDLGRDIYLRNFLQGFSTIEGFELTLSMTDFEGNVIAANDITRSLLTTKPWLAEVIESSKGRVKLLNSLNDIYVIIAEPIIYANTGTAEGALVYQIHLSEWLEFDRIRRILKETPWFSSLTMKVGDNDADAFLLTYGEHLKSGPIASSSVLLAENTQISPILLELNAHPDFVQQSLDDLLGSVTISSIVILLAAILLINLLVKKQTLKLIRLRQESEQLKQSSTKAIQFTSEGVDEVDDLANSFNALVTDLQAAYIELEDRAAQDLKQSEARFSVIIEHSASGIVTFSPFGAIETCNPAAEKIFGYDAVDLLGADIDVIIPVLSSEEQTLELLNQSYDITGLRNNGVKFDLEIAITQIVFDGEKKFIGMMRDISDRKLFENRLKVARDEAEAANLAKSQFLSSMSHELRTPLNAIMGYGQILQLDRENNLTESQSKAVDRILGGGSHLLDLINQVLDLAKIESGNMTISMEPINTHSVLDDCLSMALAMAKEKNIVINTDFSAEVSASVVKADRMRLQQAILNFLSNAVKYNVEGGTINLSCNLQSSGVVRFAVSDTGKGISEEYHDKVFTPFNRLGKEGGSIEGTGIGLAITREIVERMGGTIGFSSVEGEGSTFWLELPVASEIEAPQT